MKKILFLAYFFVSALQLMGQTTDSDLAKAVIQYKIMDESLPENDDHLIAFTQKLELALQQNNDLSEFKLFLKTIDSLQMGFTEYKSEKNELVLHHLFDGFYHWNYITKNHKIVLKGNEYHQYFTEIHSLNEDEFLLIEQRDDLVFSCNYASVYQKKANQYERKNAFGNREKLSVCNFTELEESIPVLAKDNQSLPESTSSHYSVPARKITFDGDKKTINYGECYNYATQKTTKGKAKYRNGKFKIKDCDERLFFD